MLAGSVVRSAGDRIADRYVVLDELGRGGMSIVYLARDSQIARQVALKVLSPGGSPKAKQRIRREASASNALDASRVARVFDVGETPDGELYLVMEYVKGKTARALLREGRLECVEAIRLVREVATTIGQGHALGLVHRDIKPDNILVAEDGRVVVLDFGIVKQVASDDTSLPFVTQLTTKGTIVGTPAYLSPEQALGRDVGPATDQFGLAVTAFELLCGDVPWEGRDVAHVLAELLDGRVRRISSIAPELPVRLDGVFARALAREASARFPSIEAFASALERRAVSLAPTPVRLLRLVALITCTQAARGVRGAGGE